MFKNNIELAAWCKEKAGCPYWYGTFGQTASESLLQQKKAQYPKHYADSRLKKMRSHFGRQVFDCVGLIKGYVWEQGGKIIYDPAQDVSADAMYLRCTEKGDINTMPEIKGLLVFKKGHTGVYIGDGRVVEAKGFDYGVVISKLSGSGFTVWGKCPFITYLEKYDVDGDGKVTPADARAVLRHSARLIKLTAAEQYSADVNSDGKVDAADARLIMRQSQGLS
ncbi:MAG: dockerin type I domain-containing protein [Acutalibacteraceae bacterium]|jgi:cell wall-associated NlpC family hydrolase